MRRSLLLLLSALLLVITMYGTVAAQNLDCADFATQEEAQANLDANPGDPNGLDGDNDDIACESLPSGGSTVGSSDVPTSTGRAVAVQVPTTVPAVNQDTTSCAGYDAWEWAQAVFESDPSKYAALDPDVDGIACAELPRGGFAPAFWTDKIPSGVQEAQLVRIIDGDTYEVLINGVSNRVRIYRADTPETQNEQHCGGQQATDFAAYALSFNDTPNVIYIEKDATAKDKYGRELAYVWFTVAGKPYLLNHILINNGWAADVDYGDRKYDSQFKSAAAFADRHDLGVWSLCGGFGVPLANAPAPAPAAEQPQQADTSVQAPASQDPVVNQPVPQEPVYEEPAPATGCDPNYTPCIPAYPPDLDCGEIGITVTVIGGDPHGLDRDNDGVGCE